MLTHIKPPLAHLCVPRLPLSPMAALNNVPVLADSENALLKTVMIPSTNMLSPTSGCSFTAIMFSVRLES